MKMENYYCSFCGIRGEVVLVGEVACGRENVEVHICPFCTSKLVEFWKSSEDVGKPNS
jgi:uncharacterized protein CbrC (UPF0167 family)